MRWFGNERIANKEQRWKKRVYNKRIYWKKSIGKLKKKKKEEVNTREK